MKGYGAALIGGCNAALGKYVIMGDADDSYDFLNLMPFLSKLREGYELVMGNRFEGGIEKGAMPPLHRYLGNPILSFLGRLFYPSKIKDFHCGLRGYDTLSMRKLNLHTIGMEYASEMVVQATLNKLKMTEVPTTLSPDGRSRAPHLRSWRDGWRHLKFLLMYSPKWLFLLPGLILFIVGLVCTSILFFSPVKIGGITFDIHTMLYTSAMISIGVTMMMFFVFTKVYAAHTGFLPPDHFTKWIERLTTERGVISGLVFLLLGILATIIAFVYWKNTSFGQLQPQLVMRYTIPALTLITIGIQMIFYSFFIGILNIEHK